jgi:uncharacterized protein
VKHVVLVLHVLLMFAIIGSLLPKIMKAFLSNRTLNDDSLLMKDLHHQLKDLLKHPSILSMDDYHQHIHTSRLQHAFNVTYYSYRFARLLNLKVRETVRAALMHDLFLYEWRTEQPVEGSHIDVHPQIALETAKTITQVDPLMEDIILSHMWPLGKVKPQSKEAYLVQAMDKLATLIEVSTQIKRKAYRLALSGSLITFLFIIM